MAAETGSAIDRAGQPVLLLVFAAGPLSMAGSFLFEHPPTACHRASSFARSSAGRAPAFSTRTGSGTSWPCASEGSTTNRDTGRWLTSPVATRRAGATDGHGALARAGTVQYGTRAY